MTKVYVVVGEAPWKLQPQGNRYFRSESEKLLEYNPENNIIRPSFPFGSEDSIFISDEIGTYPINFAWELGNIIISNKGGSVLMITIPTMSEVVPSLADPTWESLDRALKLLEVKDKNWTLEEILIFDNRFPNIKNVKESCTTMKEDLVKKYSSDKVKLMTFSVFSDSSNRTIIKEPVVNYYKFVKPFSSDLHRVDTIKRDLDHYFKTSLSLSTVLTGLSYDKVLVKTVVGLTTFLSFLLLFFAVLVSKVVFNK